jgi:hypothetical protein
VELVGLEELVVEVMVETITKLVLMELLIQVEVVEAVLGQCLVEQAAQVLL